MGVGGRGGGEGCDARFTTLEEDAVDLAKSSRRSSLVNISQVIRS